MPIIINSQQQRIVSLSKKYTVSKKVIVKVSYYSRVLSEYAKKIGWFGQKWSLESTITDSLFNRNTQWFT